MDIKNLEKIVDTISKFNARLLPVVKNQTIEDINKLINFGIKDLGENRLDELHLHHKHFPDSNYHFIAPLQSRKITEILSKCLTLHSVFREKELDVISKTHSGQNIFIQVNIDNDPNKSGINRDKLNDFIDYSLTLGLQPVGLMCIPNMESDRKEVFSSMQKINEKIKIQYKDYPGELSMGMSDDYEIALDYGATIIRVGSKIFL